MRTICGLSVAAVLISASAAWAGNPCCCSGTVVYATPGVAAAAPAPANVAQANAGYRSFSYEPAAAAQVPQGGQVYRSYSYSPPAAATTYSTNYSRGYRGGAGTFNPLTPKTLR